MIIRNVKVDTSQIQHPHIFTIPTKDCASNAAICCRSPDKDAWRNAQMFQKESRAQAAPGKLQRYMKHMHIVW